MTKISLYSPDSNPSLDDLLLTVDIGNGNKKITLQALADAISDSILADSVANGGWTNETELPDTIVYNGNGSYTATWNNTDLTDTISEAMKMRLTRSVATPTRCTDLESASSQYWVKTSPAGTTFTDDFCVGFWIKPESYGSEMNIVSRYNGTSGWYADLNTIGQVRLVGVNAGGANVSFVTSYQAIPLNRWSYVVMQLDMSAFTATTTTSYVMIDGADVPASVSRGGTNPTALVQAGDLNVGAANATEFYDGKIAQAWYSSAKITQANANTLRSQGLTSSLITAHNIVSAYSFDGNANDLNTTNANNLSASGSAVATNVDSPFGNYLGGVTEYAVVSSNPVFSTNTTATLQAPEGCAIPTSGGVDAVDYSTEGTPLGFPRTKNRWRIQTLIKTGPNTTSNATYGSFSNNGFAISVPIGSWDVGMHIDTYNITTTTIYFALSSIALTGLTAAQATNIAPLIGRTLSPAAAGTINTLSLKASQKLDVAATYLMYTLGATTGAGIDGSVALAEFYAEFNFI